jgi:hypothetical protein
MERMFQHKLHQFKTFGEGLILFQSKLGIVSAIPFFLCKNEKLYVI